MKKSKGIYLIRFEAGVLVGICYSSLYYKMQSFDKPYIVVKEQMSFNIENKEEAERIRDLILYKYEKYIKSNDTNFINAVMSEGEAIYEEIINLIDIEKE